MYRWLAESAYPEAPSDKDLLWHRDRWGCQFLVHPYFHLDRAILAFGCYDCGLVQFLRSRVNAGMVCMDVGANAG
ncbi:MAG: hypothetical protein ACR2QM_08395, partial [Longimicrobiales bacterium]